MYFTELCIIFSKYQTDLPEILGVVEVLTMLGVDFPAVDSEKSIHSMITKKSTLDLTKLLKTGNTYIKQLKTSYCK